VQCYYERDKMIARLDVYESWIVAV